MVFDSASREALLGQNIATKREIASLTKIFTLYTACSIVERFKLDAAAHLIDVSYAAENRVGTTAELEPGDRLSLLDLLYGLMLPSGNDAAVAISIGLGAFLLEHAKPLGHLEAEQRQQSAKASPALNARRAFMREMNAACAGLGLKSSCFQNAHGLTNTFNTSTALEIATLFAQALRQFGLFRKIVTTA